MCVTVTHVVTHFICWRLHCYTFYTTPSFSASSNKFKVSRYFGTSVSWTLHQKHFGTSVKMSYVQSILSLKCLDTCVCFHRKVQLYFTQHHFINSSHVPKWKCCISWFLQVNVVISFLGPALRISAISRAGTKVNFDFSVMIFRRSDAIQYIITLIL